MQKCLEFVPLPILLITFRSSSLSYSLILNQITAVTEDNENVMNLLDQISGYTFAQKPSGTGFEVTESAAPELVSACSVQRPILSTCACADAPSINNGDVNELLFSASLVNRPSVRQYRESRSSDRDGSLHSATIALNQRHRIGNLLGLCCSCSR